MAELEPLPYYKWHWLRYRASRTVQRMGVLERGIYRELLDEQWVQGCVRSDDESLKDVLEDSAKVLSIAKQVLSKCFTEIEPGLWQNSTLEEQRTEKDAIRSKRKIAGRLGGISKVSSEVSAEQTEANTKQVLSNCHIEEKRREEKRTTLSDQSSDELLPLSELRRVGDEREPVRRVFAYYCQTFGKSAAYVLTQTRGNQGLARFREAVKIAKDLNPLMALNEIPEAAEQLMKDAIDQMAKDDWAMGRDKNSKKTFNEWDNVFRSADQFTEWLGRKAVTPEAPKARQWAPVTEMAPRGAQ